MALSRHLSLQGFCVLLLGTIMGGQGKSCPLSWVHSREWTLWLKERGLELWGCGLGVFDQKGPTLTVNTGPSPLQATLVIAADFTEQRGLVWTELAHPESLCCLPCSQGASRSPSGSQWVKGPATDPSEDSGLFPHTPRAWCVNTAPGSPCFLCLYSCRLCTCVRVCVCVCVKVRSV